MDWTNEKIHQLTNAEIRKLHANAERQGNLALIARCVRILGERPPERLLPVKIQKWDLSSSAKE